MPIALYFQITGFAKGLIAALLLPPLAAMLGLATGFALTKAIGRLRPSVPTRFGHAPRWARVSRAAVRAKFGVNLPSAASDPLLVLAGLAGLTVFLAAYAAGYALVVWPSPWRALWTILAALSVALAALAAFRAGRGLGRALEWAVGWLFFSTLAAVWALAPSGEGSLDVVSAAIVLGFIGAPWFGARVWGRPSAGFLVWALLSIALLDGILS